MRTRSMSKHDRVRVPSVGGVRVLRGAVEVDVGDVKRISEHARGGAPIFNPNPLRLQRGLLHDDALVRRLIAALDDAQLTHGRVLGQAVALHSMAGCERQEMHTDFDPMEMSRSPAKPLGVLLALHDGTSLCLDGGRAIELSTGDVLVFDGDQVHAGAGYDASNTRIHLYLDCPWVHRAQNTTYLVQ